MCDTCGCGETAAHEHFHVVLPVSGMMCGKCEKQITDRLNQLPGVHAEADHKTGQVELILHDHSPKLDEIKKLIQDMGFDA